MNGYTPGIGDLVYDEVSHRIGEVMGQTGPYWQLRPVGGGREWDARATLRPATAAEKLSAGVALANAQSRGKVAVSAVDGQQEDASGSTRLLRAVTKDARLLRIDEAAYDMAAYQRLLEHGQSCPECAEGVCPEARALWRTVKRREP
ncbi:hypothetical protein [Streptomyces sp. 11x1]|uniref:hypothetical protein n=1 Tax=Streptomyces sp. 11x1 TaxID=3038642 RepID=UPI00292D26D9|nr:hypothetical protein [Streptomyces sp. 11x1]